MSPMPLAIALLVVLTLSTSDAATVAGTYKTKPHLDVHWNQFKLRFTKQYTTPQEESLRRVTWEKEIDFIQEHNLAFDRGVHTFTVGENEFSDWTHEEYLKYLNGFKEPTEELWKSTAEDSRYAPIANNSVQSSVWDLRKMGYVTGVKNQGSCGSCWTFSATGALEGQFARASRKRAFSLSEQNLLDCINRANLCKGGWMYWAFDYVKQNGGIDLTTCYPYNGKQGSCKYQARCSGGKDKGYKRLKDNSETDLATALTTIGPISNTVDASLRSFKSYRRGIYNDRSCGTKTTHAMLVVGYGPGYWIVKNSWGTSWGEKGYLRIQRGVNRCAVARHIVYPLV